jgi:hypothetical protein
MAMKVVAPLLEELDSNIEVLHRAVLMRLRNQLG